MPSSSAESAALEKSDHRPPPRAGLIGMWVLLASLTMLFVAGMFGYMMIRFQSANAPALGTIKLPWMLFISTAVVILASGTIHQAVRSVQRERQGALRAYLFATLVLGVVFCLLQGPPLYELWQSHREMMVKFNAQAAGSPYVVPTAETSELTAANGERPPQLANALYGLVLFLIVLHALHVVGGIVQLAWVNIRAAKGAYDHESYAGVRYSAMYWHFLDLVWIVLFGTIFIFG